MKNFHFLFPLLFVGMSVSVHSQTDIYADTWVGVDAVGRTMPTSQEVGLPKTDKQRTVGIFYITWHSESCHDSPFPYRADVTKVLEADSDARLDNDNKQWSLSSYHWGEPETGYFLSEDEWVIRRDMSMLADAGVDVIILDVTNAVLYWKEWDVLFRTMYQMKAEGNKIPKFCFWAFNGDVITVVQKLYEGVYKQNKYRDLWFYWDGKPLLLYNGTPAAGDANGGAVKHKNPNYEPDAVNQPQHPHYGNPDYTSEFYTDYTQEVKDFFTLRTMWWGYYKWAGKRFVGTEDNWSFGLDLGDPKVSSMDPVQLIATHKGRREQAAVTPAQHPLSIIGKSWSRHTGEPALNEKDMPAKAYVSSLGREVDDPVRYGIYFQERWDEALQGDPDFIYLNDWNEWTAGKYVSGKDPSGRTGGPTEFLGRKNPFYFVDQYNAEFNRTISPMKGGYTDNYYMQMAQNIRRYKGVRSIPENQGLLSVSMKELDQWDSVKVAYRDTRGDVAHRNHKGYGGLHYTDSTGRNDILLSKVAFDSRNAYFYVETADTLTSPHDSHWMMLFVDADCDNSTGWYGYDYIVNYKVTGNGMTSLMKYNGKRWKKVADTPFHTEGNRLVVAVPWKYMGWTADSVTFDFKWADNSVTLESPISFCLHGDTAPNRRFNYRCIWRR